MANGTWFAALPEVQDADLNDRGHGLRGHAETAQDLVHRGLAVHRVASLLKRWLLGTYQGAVSKAHLEYYLDEFTFRFDRRRSGSRGLLFYSLIQQAAQAPHTKTEHLYKGTGRGRRQRAAKRRV